MARWAEVGRSDPAGTVAAVVAAVAAARGLDIQLELDGDIVAPVAGAAAATAIGGDVVAGEWGPWLPGFVREALTEAAERHGSGVHHTPPVVVGEVLSLTAAHAAPATDTTTVLDPSVGGGAFLLGMAERLPGEPADVVSRLFGIDVDPLAIATTVASLSLWAGVEVDPARFVVGDALAGDPFGRAFDLVVGNPPFLGQLRGGTARDEAGRRRLADRWSGVGGYVDDAAAFLLAGIDVLAPDGTIAMLQPASMLGASAAEPVRRLIDSAAPLRAVWIDPGRAFSASVDTVAVVGRRGPSPSSVQVGEIDVESPPPASWAPLLAAARGVPRVHRPESAVLLGDVARVTAGFRDQYYGLTEAVVDDPAGAHPLITSGSIDPLRNRWNERATRFAKQRFDAPAVALDRVDPRIKSWVAARLVPKVLVASQTQVIEAIADADGRLVPCTPVVSVEPTGPWSVWHLAAVLTSPVATSWLVTESAGTALSASAVRVSAAALAALPVPEPGPAWDEAAVAAEDGDVLRCGRLMMHSYGIDDGDAMFDWWRHRMPTGSLGIQGGVDTIMDS